MSFDDYANHIYHKHRLAIALAIVKSKPPNITTNKYLEELKSKIDHKMEDDDVTVCSDDFLIDDDDDMNDSVTILKDFDPDNVDCDNNVFKDFVNEVDVDSEKPQNLSENLSQITYYDSQLTPEIAESNNNHNTILTKENRNINHDLTTDTTAENLHDNHTILNDKSNNTDHNYSKVISDKEDDYNTIHLNTKLVDSEFNQKTDMTFYDSQKTIPYTVHGFTQNYTHYSASQNDIIIPTKYIYGTNKRTVRNNDKIEEYKAAITNMETDATKYSKNDNNFKETRECEPVDEMYEIHQNNQPFEYSQTMNMFSQNNDDDFDQIRNEYSHTVVNMDSENNKTTKDMNIDTAKIQNTMNNSQNIDEYFDEMQNIDNITNLRLNFNTENNNEIVKMDTNADNLVNNLYVDHFTRNVDEIDDTTLSRDQHQFTNDENQNFTPHTKKHNQLSTISTQEDYQIIEEEHTEEIIPYKVLKEFNKVKTFLNKQNRRMSCDGYSTDSGYRSDSQIRSSRGALQLSGNWLNQSGCCLFNFIMQCPLVEGTREITNEIAEVLSQLIEKLHEDEKYPSFLEEILESVDSLIRQVYEGVDSEDNEFLKKDEHLQRILLLNKSYHIQRQTIENISKILESFHSKVTEPDSTYELTNIDRIENISYIFHILEILIKKYLKSKELLSQNSNQLSPDDEKHLKKSSLTDIWRKKWNPSQKVFEGSREKTCVLKNCSEILNRIVVDCVSCYSLVAYSALKCFNSMQS